MFVVHWNDIEIAKSNHAIMLEGAHYFPPESVQQTLFHPSKETSFCEWKEAHAEYFDIHANGKVNAGAVWRYPALKLSLSSMQGWFSFWRGVDVEWIGDEEPDVTELNYEMPNVAKALGAERVSWRAQPPFLENEDKFTGYLIPDLNIAVDVLADPGPAGRGTVIETARARAELCARTNSATKPFRYIAVWGSTPPSAEALAALKSGASVLDLGSQAEVISGVD